MSTRVKIAIPLLVVTAACVGFAVWFLGGDTPAEVDLSTAVDSVTTAPDGVDEVGDIDGQWRVDTTRGSFDFESASGTFAGFRLDEELVGIGKTEAVGRTGDVTGSITIEGTTVTAGKFAVDMASVTTNDSRRDDRVQEALDASEFPTATFTLTAPIEFGEGAIDGEPVSTTAVGDLAIHGVTKSVEIPIQAQLTGSTIVVVGAAPVVFADYDVQVPSARIVVSAADNGVFEFQLLFTKD